MTRSLTKLPAQRVGAAGASGPVAISSQTYAGASSEASASFPEIVNIIYDAQGNTLSRSETALMHALLRAKGRTVSHDYLIDQIQAYDEVSSVESLRVFLCRLRKKMPQIKIKAHKGLGYYAEIRAG